MLKRWKRAIFGMVFGIGSAAAQEIVLTTGPPRPLVERLVARPSGHHVWIRGYHRWDGSAFIWESGRWELPPQEHAVWVAPRWNHRHDGYVFVAGQWVETPPQWI